MEPYSMFITNEEKGPLEQDTVKTLKELVSKISGTDFADSILIVI
jgi:hypothetical protein